MARIGRTLSEPDLELALLRKSVGLLAAGRHACADCGRTPLRRSEPDAVELVRHFERGLTVRRVTPHAA